MVWLPGQETVIHDHVAWCVTGVLQGREYEEVFALADSGRALELAARNVNPAGAVGGFAPPGDIHRVRNTGDDVAVSMHVYGADISRLGNSIRREYTLPVRASSTPGAAGSPVSITRPQLGWRSGTGATAPASDTNPQLNDPGGGRLAPRIVRVKDLESGTCQAIVIDISLS